MQDDSYDIEILKINEILIGVSEYEHFKRQEHGESLDKCKKKQAAAANDQSDHQVLSSFEIMNTYYKGC
jgi:hypothetical protein